MLDFSKPLQTRSGYPARLVYDQFITHPYGPLVFAITHPDGIERLGFRRADGAYPIPACSNQWDIVHAVKRDVIITIVDGMIDIRSLPADVKVTVLDFDIDDVGVDELSYDGNRPCLITEFGPGEQP
jgi:hypothetical protein